MVEHLHVELKLHEVPHEIVVVDDGKVPTKRGRFCRTSPAPCPIFTSVQNTGLHGFGRAIICGLGAARSDAMVIMMADERPTTARDVDPLLAAEVE